MLKNWNINSLNENIILHSPVVTICTTSLTFNNSTFCPHSVFMCFVWIWEQTAIISLYSIDWLVFITEKECVYCAVRSTFYVLPTQCIYVICVDLITNSHYFTVQHWLVGFYNWDGVCLLRGTFYILGSAHTMYLCILCGYQEKQPLFYCTALTGWFLKLRRSVFTARYVLHSTFCPHSVFMCFVWISEETAIISLYSIDWLVFITETECVYCAVRSTFYVLPTQCIYVFCLDLRTNSD